MRWVDGRGVRWVAEAGRLAQLRQVAAALADPTLRPVREIPSRAHFRLPPAGSGNPGVFVKHYRLLGWARRLRHVVRPLPAAVEWGVARALAGHGLAAVVPWAWGQRRRSGVPVECYLLADDLGDLVTLEEWIPSHRHLSRGAFRGILAELARTLRRLHGLHYFHGDPHQRNIVPGNGSDSPRWTFLDFQQARRARLTAPYRRLRDLGRVFHGVRLDLNRTERARLLRAYLAPGARLPRRLFRALEAIALYYEFRLLRRRTRRCLTVSDHFRRSRDYGFSLWHAADADVASIVRWIGDPGCSEGSGVEVRALVSRGRRAWLGAHALQARGLPASRPLAWVVDESGGAEYLVTEYPKGTMPLAAALAASRDTGEAGNLLRAVGAVLRKLHGLGSWHGVAADAVLAVQDASGGTATWRVLFTRPEGFRFRPWVAERHRKWDVGRLARDLGRAAPALPDDAWRAFLQAYLSPGATRARREAFRRLIARQARQPL